MRANLNERFWEIVSPIAYEFDARAIAFDEMSNSRLVNDTANAFSDGKVDPNLYEHILSSLADRFGLDPEHVDIVINGLVADNFSVWHQQWMAEATEE